MKKLTVGSCFSGIGGLELGLEKTGGFKTKWQIENDPYASAILARHWPDVPRFGDIKTVNPKSLEKVDLICGGYPCQPFSLAGQRGGESDPRHLWPYMLGIICELRPRFALLENVPGHLSMGFGKVLGDLAELGYDAEWGVLSAAGVGAPHLRRRIFVVAHSVINGRREIGMGKSSRPSSMADPARPEVRSGQKQNGARASHKAERFGNGGMDVADAASNTQWLRNGNGKENGNWWAVEPDVGRMAHGVSSRVDRLKCLGNAVVPQVAQKIGEMILTKYLSSVQ